MLQPNFNPENNSWKVVYIVVKFKCLDQKRGNWPSKTSRTYICYIAIPERLHIYGNFLCNLPNISLDWWGKFTGTPPNDLHGKNPWENPQIRLSPRFHPKKRRRYTRWSNTMELSWKDPWSWRQRQVLLGRCRCHRVTQNAWNGDWVVFSWGFNGNIYIYK